LELNTTKLKNNAGHAKIAYLKGRIAKQKSKKERKTEIITYTPFPLPNFLID